MIATFLSLLLIAVQDVPPQDAAAAPVDDEEMYEEIVVQTRAGMPALVFDRGADGRLYNCRLFSTSGVDTVDAEACDNFRDCVIDENGETQCREAPVARLQGGAPILMESRPRNGAIGRLAPLPIELDAPEPENEGAGPNQRRANGDDPNRLGKLPPPPTDPTRGVGASITLGNPDQEQGDDW
ncbi:hypothetical protein [Stakelama tenebrarum]|uniref:Uncharacterized protein n=1 Tax=Stakelama tenebrarum TaxID=2711215 RepID=A0A6G6Y2T6_9SPHN|nr:hypothetical protein [Sphingosinithalassobacter tenebrarum]QIG79028.1 hypothetical protein G5C33_04010 [Sphingosinithalassobacter tenebrarum]